LPGARIRVPPVNPGPREVHFRATTAGYNTYSYLEAPASPGVDAPFEHVVTCDGDTYRLYVDGVEQITDAAVDSVDTAASLYLGHRFWGTLAEVAIYDRALPADRVVAHHKAGRATR
jgi:hypothetical protein